MRKRFHPCPSCDGQWSASMQLPASNLICTQHLCGVVVESFGFISSDFVTIPQINELNSFNIPTHLRAVLLQFYRSTRGKPSLHTYVPHLTPPATTHTHSHTTHIHTPLTRHSHIHTPTHTPLSSLGQGQPPSERLRHARPA